LNGRFTDHDGVFYGSGGWRGDIVGIYTFNNLAENGHIDVDSFNYRF
jgi:hypothetical protein